MSQYPEFLLPAPDSYDDRIRIEVKRQRSFGNGEGPNLIVLLFALFVLVIVLGSSPRRDTPATYQPAPEDDRGLYGADVAPPAVIRK